MKNEIQELKKKLEKKENQLAEYGVFVEEVVLPKKKPSSKE